MLEFYCLIKNIEIYEKRITQNRVIKQIKQMKYICHHGQQTKYML